MTEEERTKANRCHENADCEYCPLNNKPYGGFCVDVLEVANRKAMGKKELWSNCLWMSCVNVRVAVRLKLKSNITPAQNIRCTEYVVQNALKEQTSVED